MTVAKLTLIPLDGSKVIIKEYNWNDTLSVPTIEDPDRLVQVSKISIFDDTPVIDGTGCHIASMCSYT